MNIKKISAIILSLALITCFAAGCGAPERELYSLKLSKYIELGEYEGIEVDTSSDEFKEYYTSEISSDVANNNFYVKKTEGTVASGDTANIDYEGKKNGVAFEGGTAQGYNLTIGSGSFIDGFEDGLIGVQIGSTVDLNLTFPADYQSAELAGQAVVFTVKVNYVTTTEEMAPADYYAELDFLTEKAYTDDVTERAVKAYLVDKVIEDAEVKEYPEEDKESVINSIIEFYDSQYQNAYGVDFETVLSSNGMTLDDFKSEMEGSQLPAMMDRQMAMYAILDNESLEISEEALKNNESLGSDALSESYAVEDTVVDYLYENAIIK